MLTVPANGCQRGLSVAYKLSMSDVKGLIAHLSEVVLHAKAVQKKASVKAEETDEGEVKGFAVRCWTSQYQ